MSFVGWSVEGVISLKCPFQQKKADWKIVRWKGLKMALEDLTPSLKKFITWNHFYLFAKNVIVPPLFGGT